MRNTGMNLKLSLLIAIGMGACSPQSALRDGPCPGDPSCSQECSGDDCPPGFYCGADGSCTADCTVDGDQCPADHYCDNDGRCVANQSGPDGGGNEVCDINVILNPLIPTVMVLVDQSGSMDDDFGGMSRWDAARYALVDGDNGIIARLESHVVFGTALYSSNSGYEGGTCPIIHDVAPALDNYAAIAALLNNNEPYKDTPTGEAVAAVVDDFPPADPDRPAPRILVLATDGEPDTCNEPDAHDEVAQALSEGAVAAAFSAGIKTFVLSVGDDVGIAHLRRLANAGAGQALDTGTAQPYVANDPAELVDAFTEIITGTRSCTFTIDGVVDLDEADQATVELNGEGLTYGIDWTMVDESTLELLGSACDTLLGDLDVELLASFPCGTVVIVD